MILLVFFFFFFFSSRRRHTRFDCDWSSDVCSSDLVHQQREHHKFDPDHGIVRLARSWNRDIRNQFVESRHTNHGGYSPVGDQGPRKPSVLDYARQVGTAPQVDYARQKGHHDMVSDRPLSRLSAKSHRHQKSLYVYGGGWWTARPAIEHACW